MAPPHRPLVLVAEELSPEAADWLSERAEVERAGAGEREFAKLLARAEGLVVRTYTRVDGTLLAGAPRLKVVGRAGVGVDNIDVEACRARGVRVVSTPDANTRAVVEFVVAAVLDVLRPRLFLDRPLEAPAWQSLREELIGQRELAELTVGIYGLGRIGSQVARALAALEARVIYHDLREIADWERFGAKPVKRDELLARSDILSVHVDGRPENRGLVGAEAFARMRGDVIFLNTSRGFVVDNFALADFMIANEEARAVIDVHDPEPFGMDYPLLDIVNVHLTPHIASATVRAKERMSWVVRDVWRVLSGEEPESEVVRS